METPEPVQLRLPGGPFMVHTDDGNRPNWSIKKGETPETTITIESGVGLIPLLKAIDKLKETIDEAEKRFGPNKGGRHTRRRRHLRKTRRSRK